MLRVQPSYIHAKMSVVHCNNAHELVGWGLTAISRHGQRLDESNMVMKSSLQVGHCSNLKYSCST